MIVDNPGVMRDVIRRTGGRFTHPGAEEIYATRKEEMDEYATRWGGSMWTGCGKSPMGKGRG